MSQRLGEQYQIEITNRFAALENLHADEDVNRTCENIKENILISAKESLGVHELKQNKHWFNEECLGFCDQRKGAKLQRIQDPSQSNSHIDMNNMCVQEQYGFQTHCSTEQAAFTLINSILTAMNSNQMVGGILCDLQKAFDCVNHKILPEKLELCGVEGKLERLIESYLTGRYKTVTLNNITNNNFRSNGNC